MLNIKHPQSDETGIERCEKCLVCLCGNCIEGLIFCPDLEHIFIEMVVLNFWMRHLCSIQRRYSCHFIETVKLIL